MPLPKNRGVCHRLKVTSSHLFVEILYEQLFHRGIVLRVKFIEFIGVSQPHMKTYPNWTRELSFTVWATKLKIRFDHISQCCVPPLKGYVVALRSILNVILPSMYNGIL